jgi:hypothetical protein
MKEEALKAEETTKKAKIDKFRNATDSVLKHKVT